MYLDLSFFVVPTVVAFKYRKQYKPIFEFCAVLCILDDLFRIWIRLRIF